MKRFLSITLALIMILSLAIIGNTATFAEDVPAYDAEILDANGNKVGDLNLSDLSNFGPAREKVADGQTVRLLKDVTTANTVYLVGNVTFDGNGHQITYTGTEGNKNLFAVATDADKLGEGAGPSEYATVKIVNLKATTTGTILIHYFANVEFGAGNVFEASGAMFIGNRTNAGKLTFTGGEYTSKGSLAIFSLEFRAYEVEILGGSFSTTTSSIIQMNQAGGTVNIGGGKFVLSGGDGVIVNMLATASGDSKINIYDGYFYCTTWQRIVVVLAGTANVYGGVFYNTNRGDGDLFTVRNSAKLNIYGGTIINAAGKNPVQNVNNALVYPAEAKLNPTMLDGASVRLVADSNGIRFESSISKTLTDWVNGQKDAGTQISYGTLIMPTDTLPANYAFTVNALKSLGKQEGVDYVNIPAANGISKDAEGNLLIRAALVNLKEGNYNRALSAVSYVKYIKDGHEVYIYSNYNATNNSRSMAYIAQAALNDVVDTADSVYRYEVTVAGATKYSRYTEAQRTVLGQYIANN